jgi:polyhydroxyalkanoate synthesis regulator phasin
MPTPKRGSQRSLASKGLREALRMTTREIIERTQPETPEETSRELATLEDALRAEIRSAAREIQLSVWREAGSLRGEIRVLRQQLSDLKQEVVETAGSRRPTPSAKSK